MRSDRHHLFWEKRKFKTKTERQFIKLPCIRVKVDWWVHHVLINNYHIEPPKPSIAHMKEAKSRHDNRQCSCYE